ncbi:MAG: DUF6156 family protein [Methylococcaceae bacterium]
MSSTKRYFVSYSGIKLPLKLVNEIDEAGLQNRNTYYCGHYDNEERLVCCQKIVYGEIETQHDYSYDEAGVLKQARITEDDETREINY